MARKKLTEAQLAQLAPYETNMRTALKSDWTRGLGSTGLDTFARIRDEVTGEKLHVNRSCPFCLLELVRTVGRWYFADKPEEASQDEAKTETPESGSDPAETPKEATESETAAQVENSTTAVKSPRKTKKSE